MDSQISPQIACKRLKLDSVELAYTEIAGPGRPFVLLHGLTGHRDDFVHCLPDLDPTVRWLAPDLRGHGQFSHTGRPETFTFHQLVDDLKRFLDALGATQCDLLGHSVGGMVALRFALAYPERIHSLVLMSTAPFCPKDYTRQTFEAAGRIIDEKGMGFLQEALEKSWRANPDENGAAYTERWADIYWPHHRRRYRAMDPAAYAALGIHMVEQDDLTERVREIRCPTTILVGEGDHEFIAGAKALSQEIPDAVRIDISDAGHHPHMENSPAWHAAIQAHIDRTRE
ncbi:alpha/beta fold hydrolase [Myxococcota bacterium]|nr:alpha/beta fold hydrolase [Myxococcota bacterium]